MFRKSARAHLSVLRSRQGRAEFQVYHHGGIKCGCSFAFAFSLIVASVYWFILDLLLKRRFEDIVTVKKLLRMMHFNEYRNVLVVESERAYYMGCGYPSVILRRFGNLRVCSTDIADDKLKIVVKK